jgi:hypothetical protein
VSEPTTTRRLLIWYATSKAIVLNYHQVCIVLSDRFIVDCCRQLNFSSTALTQSVKSNILFKLAGLSKMQFTIHKTNFHLNITIVKKENAASLEQENGTPL